MIDPSFDSRQWDGLRQSDSGVTSFGDCEAASGYCNDDGENDVFHRK
jgi:hypothetical protein